MSGRKTQQRHLLLVVSMRPDLLMPFGAHLDSTHLDTLDDDRIRIPQAVNQDVVFRGLALSGEDAVWSLVLFLALAASARLQE